MGASRSRHPTFLFLSLALALAAFLAGHALLVHVDFDACFGNVVASVSGERPYLRVAEMSPGELDAAARRSLSEDPLVIGVLGLLPLTPFWIAWKVSRSPAMRRLWIVSAIAALLLIVAATLAPGLEGYYDCDRNGVSLGLLFMPLLYTAATLAATLTLAALRSLLLTATGRG